MHMFFVYILPVKVQKTLAFLVQSGIIIIETRKTINKKKENRKMRKTIKVEELKKEIERLVKEAIQYYNDGNNDLYEYCYNKAICYENLIKDICIDYSKSSYQKEYREIEEWFTRITNDAIYK